MKKLIISILGFVSIVSIVAVAYLYIQHGTLSKKMMTILQREIVKQYPTIGYGFTCSLDGTVLSHPLLSEVHDKKIESLFDASEEKKLTSMISDLATQKEILTHDIKDQKGNSVELFLMTIDGTVHGLVFFHDELKKFIVTQERHILIFLSLSILMGLCCLILLVGVLFLESLLMYPQKWWYIIGLLSCVMLVEVRYLWSLHESVGFQENLQTTPILSKSQEFNFFQKLQQDSPHTFKAVPTGIFVEHTQFSQQGADIHPGVFLKGYVWQRYNTKEHATIDRDVIIANAYICNKQEIYHQTNQDEETICWAFSCNLYETFNPKLYPFDHRHIILNLLHKNFEKNIVLTPDLNSYEAINSIFIPGVSSKITVLSHWKLVKSFFNFEIFNFKTTLGASEFAYNQMPYLQFIMNAQRRSGGGFIMHFVLLFVVLITLFILLMAFLRQETLIDIVGFSTLSVIGVCSALLFVLITSEINLRQLLMTEGLVYLELLYFICYFVTIGVVINSILFAVGSNLKFFMYQDNLIFKLCYWPSILLSTVLITAYMFY